MLLLYLLLFGSGLVSQGTYPDRIPLSLDREIIRIFAYALPALGFIWYRLCRYPLPQSSWVQGLLKPRVQDLLALGIALLGLGSIGFCLALAGPRLAPYIQLSPSPDVEAPQSLLAWVIILGSCFATGYLEESYFRVYLLLRLKEAGIGTGKRVFLSCLLFSLCHTYEGPWGILQAALAGMVLSLVFIQRHAFHGIAWAHGAYNALVYLMASVDR
jgi:membrane protease YdiL (CAAX protease family)